MNMDYSEDAEINRLKKLLEERILQAEKENMAIIKGLADVPEEGLPVTRSSKTCPHVKSSSPVKQDWSNSCSDDVHSRIHFINDSQSSLLMSANRRRNIVDYSKNKYMPCAIQLSPPVRLKREISEENRSISRNSHCPSNACKKDSVKDFKVNQKHFPPSVTCDKVVSENKIFTKISQSSPVGDRKQKTQLKITSEESEFTEVKNLYQTSSFIKDQSLPSFKSTSSDLHFMKNPNITSHKMGLPEPKSSEVSNRSAQDTNDDKPGLHLQISLDSCSTKDVISKILHKIPEFVKKDISNYSATNSRDFSEEKLKQNKICQTPENFNVFDKHRSFHKSHPSPKNLETENIFISSFTQTDKGKEELLVKKEELQNLIKEIVLETLENMKIHEEKSSPICQKIDSGIQSEVEVNTAGSPNHYIREPLDTRVVCSVSQVDLYPLKHTELHDKSSNTDTLLQEDMISTEKQEREEGFPVSETQDTRKIELMLEKIYDHICGEKEVINDISLNNPILTRDVAVQFNPVLKSTKSTLTTEIKTIDSYCQYDNEVGVPVRRKTCIDTSVQTGIATNPYDDFNLQINAYTQCEQKAFLDSVVQTELLLNSEHSATNTSVSSTPVSDSMFMDDLLSEGEISLPWNLRLISVTGSGLSVNNPESSDTSIKEKDYSLSEGEIHPNVVQFVNKQYSSNLDCVDLQQYPTKFMAEKTQHPSDKWTGQSNTFGKNPLLNVEISSCSEGELNSNISLSSGEIPPAFVTGFVKSDNCPFNTSSCSRDELQCNSPNATSSFEVCDTSGQSLNPSFTENTSFKNYTHEENDLYQSSTLLETVDEEVHSVFD